MPFTPLVSPIPGPDAGGIDLTFLPEFDAIHEARRADAIECSRKGCVQKTMGKLLSIVLAAGLSGYSTHAQATAAWTGRFEYGDAISGSRENSAMFSYVTLLIRADGSCLIDHEGFQTLESIECSSIVHGDTVDVVFNADREDSLSRDVYREGDVLFSMQRDPGTQKINTVWRRLRPNSAESLVGNYMQGSALDAE
jgi:hypothetical protein